MADLGDVDRHTTPQTPPPAPTFRFAPGSEVGEAEFTVQEGQDVNEALEQWAASVLGLPQDAMRLLDIVEVRAWGRDPAVSRPYRYVKARVARQGEQERQASQAAEQWVRQRRPRTVTASADVSDRAVWWPVADTQLGKGNEWLGTTPATLARLDWAAYQALPQWTKTHAPNPARIVIPLLGDLTEGCSGSYRHQTYTVTHNAAEQLELAIEAVDRLVTEACRLAPEVVVTGVASNHDAQSRDGGKSNITDPWDDRTFVLLRTLARVYAEARPQVTVQLPADPHVLVHDDGNLTVAGIHGHVPKKRPTVVQTMWEWWSGATAGHQDAGAAQVLLTGHYHTAADYGISSGRYLCCLPSLDNGSQFFTDMTGEWSLPGVRPFATSPDGLVGGRAAMLVWPEDRARAAERTGRVA